MRMNGLFLFGAFSILVMGCTLSRSHCPSCADASFLPSLNTHGREPRSVDLREDPVVAGPQSVDYYVQLALARNPEVQALQAHVDAQSEVYPQVTALPDPVLSESFWPFSDNSPQTAAGRMTNTLTLAQRFPWFDKLRVRGEVADAQTQIALTQLAEAELKIIENVKSAYYEIYFNQKAVAVTEDMESFIRQYIELADAQFRVLKKASQQDVIRAEVELRQLQDTLIQLRKQQRVAQADLAKLLSVSPETTVKAADSLALPPVPEQIESLYQVALATRPELQGRFHAILRDEQKVRLAELEYCPDVTLGVSWSSLTTADALVPVANGRDNVGFGISINLPIWRDKLDAGVREARNRVEESARLYDVTRDDTLRMVRRLVTQAQALEQQIELYRTEDTGIIARAEHALRLSVADYRVQKVDALTVLDNFNKLLRFRIQLVRLEASLGQVLASLERMVGGALGNPKPPTAEGTSDAAKE